MLQGVIGVPEGDTVPLGTVVPVSLEFIILSSSSFFPPQAVAEAISASTARIIASVFFI